MSNPAAHSGENTKFIILIACVATIGGFLFGFDMSTMNSAINGIAPSLELSSFQTGLITSIAMIGAAVTGFFHYVKVGPEEAPEDEDDVPDPIRRADGELVQVIPAHPKEGGNE